MVTDFVAAIGKSARQPRGDHLGHDDRDRDSHRLAAHGRITWAINCGAGAADGRDRIDRGQHGLAGAAWLDAQSIDRRVARHAQATNRVRRYRTVDYPDVSIEQVASTLLAARAGHGGVDDSKRDRRRAFAAEQQWLHTDGDHRLSIRRMAADSDVAHGTPRSGAGGHAVLVAISQCDINPRVAAARDVPIAAARDHDRRDRLAGANRLVGYHGIKVIYAMTRKILILILLMILMACVTPTPSPLPTPTLPSSPLPTSTPLPLPLPYLSPIAPPMPNYSKLSVMIGNQPSGLGDFLLIAQPTVIYSINNAVESTILRYSPHTLLVRRIQNDVWERLPNDWYKGLGTSHWEQDARISARNWAITKTIAVAGGRYNLLDYSQLSYQDFLAPINEPVLGDRGDHILKAQWLNAWVEEWLTLAHARGIKSSIFSFPSGEPPFDAVPYLAGAARAAAQYGDIIDVHEYGIEGELMSSPSSGALRYRQFHDALPLDARPMFVVSEASGGNGYDTGIGGGRWIDDMIAYGKELRRDPYLIGAAAFQLDQNAESNIPPDVLRNYANAAAAISWTQIYAIYLPDVRR